MWHRPCFTRGGGRQRPVWGVGVVEADVDEANQASHARHQPGTAALTPRPVRLLLIGRVRPGQEATLRAAQVRFPFAAAAAAGIDAVEAYIGSSYYAVELEIADPDVQAVLAKFFNDPRVREFRASLDPAVAGLPEAAASFSPADPDHDAPAAAAADAGGSVFTSADLPFAASMYRWRVGELPETGAEPRGGGVL